MRPIKISAQCELVTPMLSSGADQRKFELRATSVKSALRFWWRAFHPLDAEDLYEEESRLFGNTELSSRFGLILREKNIQLWRPGDEHGWGEGLQYILFSINQPERRGGGRYTPARISPGRYGRSVAKPGSTFEINIMLPGIKSKKTLGDILCSLWLVENLGGLGARTRRGCGCFKITNLSVSGTSLKSNGSSLPRFFRENNEPPKDFIVQGLSKIWKRWGTLDRKKTPNFTCFYLKSSEVWILYKKSCKAIELIELIGSCMRSFRLRNPHTEAEEMHWALSTTTPPSSELLTGIKSYLGLPIIYNFKQNFGNLYGPNLRAGGRNLQYVLTTVKVDKSGQPKKDSQGEYIEGNGRRSSPLLISCHDDGTNAWSVICHFPAPLLPSDEKLWFKANAGNGALDVICSPPYSQGLKFARDLIKNIYKKVDNVICIKN